MAPLSLRIVQDNGTVTKKVKLDPAITVLEAHATIRDKMNVKEHEETYGLFLRTNDTDVSGVWMEDHRTLRYYMLKDGDRVDYMTKIRNLRIKMLDDSVKTLQVDQSKIVGDLMISICSRLGITNHEEYGLCLDEEAEESKENKGAVLTGNSTLKKSQLKDRDLQFEEMIKKFKTDDNVQWVDVHKTLSEACVAPQATVLLKRRLFYSDRNVDSRDPVQLNLLYVQVRDNILDARHPVTEGQGKYLVIGTQEREAPLTKRHELTTTTRRDVADLCIARPTSDTARLEMSVFKNKTIKRNMQKMFSAKVDQRLINLVKANPVLYDFNDRKYMDFNTREVAWQKIGDELEKPAADCKVRWINIRDVHRRIIRKSLSGLGRPARAYKYDKQLEFMRNFYKEVVTANAMSDEEDENDDDDKNSEAWNDARKNDSEVEDEKPLKKPKRSKRPLKSCVLFEEVDVSSGSTHDTSTYDRETDSDVSDPVDAFLLSIGATLKKFSPYHLNLAKSKIFHIVQEHDLQQIVEKRQGRLDCDVSTSSEPIYYQG